MTWPDRWGPGVSEGRKKRVPVWLGRKMGRRPLSRLGFFVSPGLFPFFSVLFLFSFLISISLISFSNLVQIDSNKLVNFPKIQNNTVRQ
jgi:hypothetical protein